MESVVGRWVFLALLMGCGCGCSVVMSDQPMGSAAVTDLSGWEGVWRAEGEDCPVRVEVADAERGELRLSAADEDACPFGDDDPPKEFMVVVRQSGNKTYASIDCTNDDCSRNDGPADRFLWALVDVGDDAIRVSVPITKAFVALVDQGLLTGERVRPDYGTAPDDVLLFAPEDWEYDVIAAEDPALLVDMKNPLKLRRVTPELSSEPRP